MEINYKNFFKLFFSFSFYFIGISSFFLNNVVRVDYYLIFYFWIFYFFKSDIFDSVKGQKLIFFIIILLLYFIPSISILYIYKIDTTYILFIVVIFMDILNKFSDELFYSKKVEISKNVNSNIRFLIYLLLLTWSVIGPFFLGQDNNIVGILSHIVPSALSLIYLEGILRSSKSSLNSSLIILFHFLFIIFFLNNHWSGYGRLHLGFYLLAPIIIFISVYNISIKNIFIFIAAPIALFLLQYFRYNTEINLENVTFGSAGYHLYLTDIIFNNQYDVNINSIKVWIDELKLLFLIWFPREYWELKPIGISMWSVDLMFGRTVESYSQSVGFIGEQKLILGDKYIFGIMLMLILILIFRKLIVYLSFGSNVPAIIFDLNLMSYFWGGMALFGSRLWFSLIPAILFLIFRYIFLRILKFNDKNKIHF